MLTRRTCAIQLIAAALLGGGFGHPRAALAQPSPAGAADWAWSGIPSLEPEHLKTFPRAPLLYTPGPYQGGDGPAAMVFDGSYVKVTGPYTPEASTRMAALWSLVIGNGGPDCQGTSPPCPEETISQTRWPQTAPLGDVTIPHAISAYQQSISTLNSKTFVAAESPGIDGRPDIVTLAYTPTMSLLWSNRYSFPWHEDPRAGADVPVAVVSPSLLDSKGFSWPFGMPVTVVGRSMAATLGNQIVLLIYNNDNQGAPLVSPRRWSSGGGPHSDEPVAAAYGQIQVPGESEPVPVLYVAGTKYDGTARAFVMAFMVQFNNTLSTLPKPGAPMAGFPQYVTAPSVARGLAVTRDGVYLVGDDQVSPSTTGSKVFLAKFALTGGPMLWIDEPAPAAEATTERAVAIATAPIVAGESGTFVYVGGTSVKADGTADFLMTQTHDEGSGPIDKWTARWHRPANIGGQSVDTLTTIAVSRELPQEPEFTNYPLVFATGSSLNASGRLNILTAKFNKFEPVQPLDPKEPVWSMTTPAPDAVTDLYPVASFAQRSAQGYLLEIVISGRMSRQCNGTNQASCGDSFFATKYFQFLE